MTRKLLVSLLTCLCLTARAEGVVGEVDRLAPDFVKASLLWIGPGTEFFACAGHSSIRLECPTYKLDFCFSCESEAIRTNLVRFVMGDLRTGMFAIPTQEFLSNYGLANRGCRQYTMNLPPDVKQRLWKLMDDQVDKGQCLPYDYIKFCCVQTMLQPLLEAIRPRTLKTAPWPPIYRLTRREVLANDLAWCPWTRFFLHTIAGTEVDRKVSEFKSVILSRDFVELLKGATIDGKPVLTGEYEVLLPFKPLPKTTFFTPMVAAVLLLLLAVVNLFVKKPYLDALFLGLQTALGVLIMHLVFISTLPATEWNWLIVPFNLLPLVFWKCRKKWALPFCVLLLVWEAFVLLHPHQITDPAYYMIVAAYIVVYAKQGMRG